MPGAVLLRDLGLLDYQRVWRAMRDFTDRRDADTADEIWLLQHPPVYTQGLSCDRGPLGSTSIPVVATDRGGQETYHGPGQLVVYVLLDLRRRGRGAKWLVELLEQSVLELLAEAGIAGARRAGAPGVYVDGRKVAALGLRIRRGASYHGLSLNVAMDLEPFQHIHPCGYEDLEVTQLRDLGLGWSLAETQSRLTRHLLALIEDSRA